MRAQRRPKFFMFFDKPKESTNTTTHHPASQSRPRMKRKSSFAFFIRIHPRNGVPSYARLTDRESMYLNFDLSVDTLGVQSPAAAAAARHCRRRRRAATAPLIRHSSTLLFVIIIILLLHYAALASNNSSEQHLNPLSNPPRQNTTS